MCDVDATQSRATIDDVAARAGVSISTVSRVVNGRYGVAPATLDRVRAAVVDLGYETSLTARSLRSGADERDRRARRGHRAVQRRGAQGHRPRTAGRPRTSSSSTPADTATRTAGSSATCRGSPARSPTAPILLTPTVVEVAYVEAGGRRRPARRWLANADDRHRELRGCRSPRPATSSSSAIGASASSAAGPTSSRRGGVSRATASRWRRPALRSTPTSSRRRLHRGAPRGRPTSSCRSPRRPTAIFAANDLTAIQTIRTPVDLGLAVPDDLSIVGFDNIPESALTDPPLTTIDQSLHAVGREAVRALIELIEHAERTGSSATEPMHVTLPTTLVVRQSCAAPRAPRADNTTATTQGEP